MTENQNRKKIRLPSAPSGLSSFHIEANRSTKGLSIVLSGIIGISDFSDIYICFKSHGGRIKVMGKNLFLNVYEGGSAEVVGRIEEIMFDYGKA